MGDGFFNVITKKQTYLNLVYLLISLPLGILYFTLIITGISTGLGLIITLIGIPLLILMSFIWYWLGTFERTINTSLLNIKIKPSLSRAFKQKTFFKKIETHLKEPITWKSLAYTIIKFPIGIISFVLLTVLLSLSLGLMISPLLYNLSLAYPSFEFATINGIQIISSIWQAWGLTIIGIFFLLISLHILNKLAQISGIIAKSLLGK